MDAKKSKRFYFIVGFCVLAIILAASIGSFYLGRTRGAAESDRRNEHTIRELVESSIGQTEQIREYTRGAISDIEDGIRRSQDIREATARLREINKTIKDAFDSLGHVDSSLGELIDNLNSNISPLTEEDE